jgi:tripartite-type tricarboxylate transporter receptor subunit TctC
MNSLLRSPLRRLQCVVAAVTLAAMPVAASAQTYPARTVRVVVPAAPGGPSDIIGRILAQKLSESWGQPFVVENLPAGAGNVAVGMVAKSTPDGYTIVMPTSAVIINPSLYARLPYDTVRDFAAVTNVAASPHVLTVNPSLPARTVRELIALVRANPSKMSYASPGTGTTGQLAGELFRLSLGLDLVHVPFNGAAPGIASTIGGHTPMMFGALPGAASSIKDGRLRALAVTSGRRAPEFPDVPTLAEAGVPDQESEFIQAVLAPAGTPKEIVDKLQREIARIVALPEVRERLLAIGYTPIANTPEEFTAQIKTDVARWAKVIREAGIKQIE